MLTKTFGASIRGVDMQKIEVEVDATKGLPQETIVGLPDLVVKESKSRIKAAIKHAGFDYPLRHYTINLAPAEVKKEGPLLDLAIAVGILRSGGQLPDEPDAFYLGELSLDGKVKPVRGFLAICYGLLQLKEPPLLFCPSENMFEANLIHYPRCVPLNNLSDLKGYYAGKWQAPVFQKEPIKPPVYVTDFKDVKGQYYAKRAIEVAVAGHHNILFVGPPGSGKSMLSKRVPTIMTEPTSAELIDILKIQGINKNYSEKDQVLNQRPFRAPHHSISYAGMVGGGSNPKPGEVTLSHRGVLYLDEFPEFARQVIEVLRQPLEDREISISRASMSVTYPANFMLVATMNPCPCGYFTDLKRTCQCHETQVRKYWKKLSGPILDRIDLIVEVPRLLESDYFESGSDLKEGFQSLEMKKRVRLAETVQKSRFKDERYNSEMSVQEIEKNCFINAETRVVLEQAVKTGMLSGRGFHKVLKVSRTIADIEGAKNVELGHVMEALQYRSMLQTFNKG